MPCVAELDKVRWLKIRTEKGYSNPSQKKGRKIYVWVLFVSM